MHLKEKKEKGLCIYGGCKKQVKKMLKYGIVWTWNMCNKHLTICRERTRKARERHNRKETI